MFSSVGLHLTNNCLADLNKKCTKMFALILSLLLKTLVLTTAFSYIRYITTVNNTIKVSWKKLAPPLIRTFLFSAVFKIKVDFNLN